MALPAIDPATRRWMCPEIPIWVLNNCKNMIREITREEAKVNIFTNKKTTNITVANHTQKQNHISAYEQSVPFCNCQKPWTEWLHKERSWPSLPRCPCTSQGSLPSAARLWEWQTRLKITRQSCSCGTHAHSPNTRGIFCLMLIFTQMFVMGVLGLKQNLDSVQRSNRCFGATSCYTCREQTHGNKIDRNSSNSSYSYLRNCLRNYLCTKHFCVSDTASSNTTVITDKLPSMLNINKM